MNFTKLILSIAVYGAGSLTPAIAVADADPEKFQADKDRYIVNILDRIKIDQKNLSCVQAAQDHTALKACDETVKQDRPALEPKVEAPQNADKKVQKAVKNKKQE
jgi:hypothetical protein